jgi:hypothetical protein
MALFIVALVIISSGICYSQAKRKNRNIAAWVSLAAIIGPLAVPFVYLVSDQSPNPHDN